MKKVLLVGHCGPDTLRISMVLEKIGATYEGAFNHIGGIDKLENSNFDLVLPNRVFGSDENGGVSFIKAMKENADLKDIPVMLVSAIDEAQKKAIAAGALEGFGKDELEKGSAEAKMKVAMGI